MCILLLEPGRSIVGPAGVLLTSVLYRKENDGKRFLVVDAAMNDLIRPALYGAYHEIVPVVADPRSCRPRKRLSMWWVRCASPATSSRAIGSCLAWKRATCLRFLSWGLRDGAGFELQHASAARGSAGERKVSQGHPAAGKSSRTVFRGAVSRASVPANDYLYLSLPTSVSCAAHGRNPHRCETG